MGGVGLWMSVLGRVVGVGMSWGPSGGQKVYAGGWGCAVIADPIHLRIHLHMWVEEKERLETTCHDFESEELP